MKCGRNQHEEMCCHKRETVIMSNLNKYYYAMKSQYNNISIVKLKQLSKFDQAECDVKCTQSMINYCKEPRNEHNEVWSSSKSQNRKVGDYQIGKQKEIYSQCDVTLPDCVVSPLKGVFQ